MTQNQNFDSEPLGESKTQKSVMNVYHGTSNDALTDLLCTALDCICDPFNYYELTDEKKQGNPLHKHIMLLSYDAVKVNFLRLAERRW